MTQRFGLPGAQGLCGKSPGAVSFGLIVGADPGDMNGSHDIIVGVKL